MYVSLYRFWLDSFFVIGISNSLEINHLVYIFLFASPVIIGTFGGFIGFSIVTDFFHAIPGRFYLLMCI